MAACPAAPVACAGAPTLLEASAAPPIAAPKQTTRQREAELCSSLCGVIAVLTAGNPEEFSFSGRRTSGSPNSFESYATTADRAEAEADPDSGSIETLMRAALERLDAPAPAAVHEAKKDAHQMLTLMLDADVPAQLLAHHGELGFEAQKDAMRLFGAALQAGQRLGAEAEIAAYVRARPQVARLLLDGCASPDNVLHCGHMLRACAHNCKLVEVLLEAGAIEKLAELAAHESFEVSSDAFASLRELLLRQGEAMSEYLTKHFAAFFGLYHRLVLVDDYAKQRQALRLLGEILLHSAYTAVMVEYVSEVRFLQIQMNLLRDPSTSIKVGAFHVFKIFVANPNRPARVQKILRKNRSGLMRLLRSLIPLREDDESFEQDVQCILQMLGELSELPAGGSSRRPALALGGAPPSSAGEGTPCSFARAASAPDRDETSSSAAGSSSDNEVGPGRDRAQSVPTD